MDLKEIKAIIDLMKKNSLAEFEIEEKDFKLKLKRPITGAPMAVGQMVDDPELTAFAPLSRQMLAQPSSAPTPAGAGSETEIKSPMIGTFYRAPSPDAANYVDVGVEVGPDTVVGIIEAMKVMNEIKAEVRGIITAAVAENTKPVEFGQPLFRIRPI